MRQKILCSMIVMFSIIFVFVIKYINNEHLSLDNNYYKEGSSLTANEYLISKANGLNITFDEGNTSEMYTFEHEKTEQTDALIDYRYIGDTPNNYVYFNCTDDYNTDTCELWRIIGVFETENENGVKEKRVKLVKNQSIGTFTWSDSGENDWSTSSLNQYLNSDYLNSLSNTSKLMIANAKFYLGGITDDDQIGYGSAEDIYNSERGMNVYNNRNTNSIEKIGLMYLSDYAYTYDYVNNNCYTNIRNCGYFGSPIISSYDLLIARSWIGTSTAFRIWLINSVANIGNEAIVIKKSAYSLKIDNKNYVRPVLYLKSDVYISKGSGNKNDPYILSLNNETVENGVDSTVYKEYKIGDKITYQGETFYVIKNSNSKTNYVTLLREKIFSNEEIYKYSSEIYNKENIPYYSNDLCTSEDNVSECTSNYDNSLVKQVVEKWADDKLNLNDLVDVNGYKTRLITKEELFDYLGYDHHQLATGEGMEKTDDTPEWIYKTSYWTMSEYYDSTTNVFSVLNNGYVKSEEVYNSSGVRPVINLNKCVLDGGCHLESVEKSNELKCVNGIRYKNVSITKYNEFKSGDEIEYNGDKYYVISDSNSKLNYITLLKDKPLTVDELYKYGRDENDHLFVNEYVINSYDPEKVVYEYSDEIGGMAFYTSKTCGYEINWNVSSYDKKNIITVGCTNNYDNSDIKKVLDNWSKEFNDELVEISGYKTRLLTIDELVGNLGYQYGAIGTSSTYGYISTWNTPEWVYNGNYSYWTMIKSEDDNDSVLVNHSYGDSFADLSNSREYAVRPVINLDKCAIDGGCWEEKIEDGCIDTNDENYSGIKSIIVNVENTFKSTSKIFLVICLILIFLGTSLLGYSYVKRKKKSVNR